MGKLEGPKKHHDNHGNDASKPMKGSKQAVPDKHWEMKYDGCVYKDTKSTRGVEFSPKRSDARMTTYNKVNETDH